MKNKKERRQRLSFALLFSAIVILIFLVVLLLVAFCLYVLLRLRELSGPGDREMSTTELILLFAVAALVVGSILTFFISRYPMQPVNHLLNTMNRLASGDFSVRIRLPKLWNRHPGIVELADSFNKMAQELQGTEVLRSDFINNFSHEFKTPIVSIAGFAKLLKREQLTEQQAEYVRIIEEESLRLSAMATNVLNLTRIENQTILTDVTTFNLSEQIRSCILLLEPKWSRKEQQFQLELEEYTIRGNEELLKQVWINLVENAVKFSPRDAQIHVDIRPRETSLEVCIRNPSRELTREQLTRIFNKFYQADASHATEGNGIGLAIVQGVVRLHGGTVWVTSDQGATTFTVELPR